MKALTEHREAPPAPATAPAPPEKSRTLPNRMKFPDSLEFSGYAKPVRLEADAYDCEVEGEIPFELNGAYYQNSPEHLYPPLHGEDTFLNGDGMVRMVRFENGHADLKTRYVQTEKFKMERAARRALFGYYRNPFFDEHTVAGLSKDTANTSMGWHAGKLYALKEDAHPVVLDPKTLETRSTWNFNGKLTGRSFTAHPKKDPLTGEWMAFGYNTNGGSNNLIDMFTISPEGEITRYETFEVPFTSMVHDYMVSRNYSIFTVCPMTTDMERVRLGEKFWHWNSKLPTWIAVVPRKEGVQGIRWFKAPSTVMETHTFNAWEDGSVVHADHFINTSGWIAQFPDIHNPAARETPPFAERWSMDLSKPGDTVAVQRIFQQVGEMPVIDPRYAMRRARHFYFGTTNTALGPMLPMGYKGPPFNCLGHYDEGSDKLDFFYAGADSSPEEPCFVPKPGGKEGEGWLITVVGRRVEMRTDLVILDATCLANGPLATVKFPCRVHEGVHGIWVPDWQLKMANAW